MIGLDSNILVQLAFAVHPSNSQTLNAVEKEISSGQKLVFPALTATEFLHVATDPRRFDPPLTMVEAMDWLEHFLTIPSVQLIEPTLASLHQTTLWMRQHKLGRKRILDTHLAAVLHAHGIKRLLTSNSKDFLIFGVFEIVTP